MSPDNVAVLAVLGGFSFVFFAIGVVFYVLKSLGLYALAANKNIENPWLAWIPIGDIYIMGSLVEEMDVFGNKLTNLGIVSVVVMIGGVILTWIPFIGILFSLALLGYIILLVYNLFMIYSENAVLFTILSIILGLFPIFIFVIRNNPPLDGAVNKITPVQ